VLFWDLVVNLIFQ